MSTTRAILNDTFVIAAKNNDIELLKAEANLENISVYGGTALQYAAENGHAAVVDFLLENKVNPNHQNKEELTPLYYAFKNKHYEIVERLLASMPCSLLPQKVYQFSVFHTNILKLLNNSKILKTLEGACKGLSMLFVILELISKREDYAKLFIHHGLMSSADLCDEKKEEKSISKMDTIAFLNTVALFQLPSNYQYLFENHIWQSDIKPILSLAQPKLLEQLGGADIIYTDAFLYYLPEWSAFLAALRKILHEEYLEAKKMGDSLKLTMLISLSSIPDENIEKKEIKYSRHAIPVSYDGRWFMADSNGFPTHVPDMRPDEFKTCCPDSKEVLVDEIVKNSTLPYLWKNKYYKNKNQIMPGVVKIFTTRDNPRFPSLFKKCKKLQASTPPHCPSLTETLKRRTDDGDGITHLAVTLRNAWKLNQLKKAGASLIEPDKEGNAPIHLAIMRHSLPEIKYFISKKYSLDLPRSTDGNIPLLFSAGNNFTDMLALFFQAGVNLSMARSDGVNAMHMAAIKDASDAFKFLFCCGVAISATNNEGFAALHFAVRDGSRKIIDLITHDPEIKLHMNLDQSTSSGITALHLAAQNDRYFILKKLVESGAKTSVSDDFGQTPLHAATAQGHLEITRYLLKNGADALTENNDGETPLFYAAINNHWKVVALLLQNTSLFQINKMDEKIINNNKTHLIKAYAELFPVHYAATTNNIEMLDMLFADGADLQKEIFFESPLFLAYLKNNTLAVHWFLSHGIDLNRERRISVYGDTKIIKRKWLSFEDQGNGYHRINSDEYIQLEELHDKITKKQSVVELLEKIRPEFLKKIVNYKMPYHEDYYSSVHLAVKYGELDTLKALSSKGANFSMLSGYREITLLHLAARNNHMDVMRYLIDTKIMNVNIQRGTWCTSNTTPIFECAIRANIECAEFLIAKGANVNHQTEDGVTPLHEVCRYGFIYNTEETVENFVRLLLKHGADPALKGTYYPYHRATAVEMISNINHRTRIEKVIEEHLALSVLQTSSYCHAIKLQKTNDDKITDNIIKNITVTLPESTLFSRKVSAKTIVVKGVETRIDIQNR